MYIKAHLYNQALCQKRSRIINANNGVPIKHSACQAA